MGNRRHDARFIQDRRPNAADQASGLEMRLPQHGDRGVIRFRRLLRLRVLLMPIGFELHDRPGQLLGKPVVDFIGDQLPFVVARLQQVLERAMLFLQRLLRLPSLRGVADKMDQAGPPIVGDPVRHDIHVHNAAVFPHKRDVFAVRYPSFDHGLVSFRSCGQHLGRMELFDRENLEFFLRIPEQLAHRTIGPDAIVRRDIQNHQSLRHPVVNGPKLLVVLLQRFLRPLAFRNISNHRHQRDGLPLGVANHGGRQLGGNRRPIRAKSPYTPCVRAFPTAINSAMFAASRGRSASMT